MIKLIKYERAGKEDFEAVAGVIVNAYKDFVNPDLTKEDLHSKLMKSGHHVNVAREGDEIVGAIIFGLIDSERCGTYGSLTDLGVSKEYRKRGIGTRLLRSAIKDLTKLLGNSEKVIRARIDSSSSYSIVEKLGFEEDIFWGRDDELHVKLELPNWVS